MKSNYDKQSDALAIRFHDGIYAESVEAEEGIIFDYDENGKLLAIEVLDVSEKFPAQFAESVRSEPISILVESQG